MSAPKPAIQPQVTERVPTLSRLRDIDRTVSSDDEDIRGRMVKDKDGQDLGKVDGLLIDDLERRVRFMEVASGGFLGFGESRSFIPIEAITRITADEVWISHSREHVAGAPRYDPDLVTTDDSYYFGLYPYYGYGMTSGFFPESAGSPWSRGPGK